MISAIVRSRDLAELAGRRPLHDGVGLRDWADCAAWAAEYAATTQCDGIDGEVIAVETLPPRPDGLWGEPVTTVLGRWRGGAFCPAESPGSFADRIWRNVQPWWAGHLDLIPDAPADTVGCVVASSVHGTVLMVDRDSAAPDDDRFGGYRRIVMLNRSPFLPGARRRAPGRLE